MESGTLTQLIWYFYYTAELTFDDLKEEEVKRFLVELSMLTDQIKEGLVGGVTDSQSE